MKKVIKCGGWKMSSNALDWDKVKIYRAYRLAVQKMVPCGQ